MASFCYTAFMNQADKARAVIDNNNHMTIATINADGKPWITPVFYVHDDHFSLYWVSYKESKHSKNIQSNPDVAISIYGSVPPDNEIDAVYIEAEATQLEDEADVLPAIAVLAGRIQEEKYMIKFPKDVMGEAAWRIYRATPKVVSKRTENRKTINGQYITTREDVDL